MDFQFNRVPRWIVAVGVIGAVIWLVTTGPRAALIFSLATAASWWSYRHLVTGTGALVTAAAQQSAPPTVRIVSGIFLRFAVVAVGALVILKYSRISVMPLFAGLFASCIGIALEIIYELLWVKSTKSG